MATVSIIMPAYNSQDTIQEAIDSVKNQSYTDWELLVVDDGSTDQTRKIIEQNIEYDQRIRLIVSNHGGPGGAKNRGIEAATGQYIGFIDSDDLFEPRFIEAGVNKLDQGYDCVIYDYIRFNTNEEVINKVDIQPFDSYAAAWNKLYRANLWERIRFPENSVIEDFEVVPVVVAMASKVLKIVDVYYRYRMNPTSITHDYDASRVGEVKEALNLLVKNMSIYAPKYQDVNQLARFANQMMYNHLREGVQHSHNRKDKKLIVNDLVRFYHQYNSSNFDLNKTLYNPNKLKQLRNDLMLGMFKVGCYRIGVGITLIIERLFGNRRNPR